MFTDSERMALLWLCKGRKRASSPIKRLCVTFARQERIANPVPRKRRARPMRMAKYTPAYSVRDLDSILDLGAAYGA